MMDPIKQFFTHLSHPKHRKALISGVSGGLILLGLAAGILAQLPALRDTLMTVATLTAGWDIARRAYHSLRNRHASIELLVTIATAGALIIGEYWEAAAVTFLFVFGAYLEARTLARTRQVLQDLFELAPTTAIVLREGRQVEVLAHEVEPGEQVLIKPGSQVPVDGEVTEGRSAVDESAITGEPLPEEKSPGEQVFAGTVNQNGLLTVLATGVGADTTLARIIHRVEEAQEEKAPTQRFIERFARWYTPGIIALSLLVLLISRDLRLALTLLVIACPGALVISTPISIVAGIGRAARRGILIKGGEHLESAGKISAVALDKTGTLTRGKPSLARVVALRAAPVFAGVTAGIPAGAGTQTESPVNGTGWSPEQLDALRWAAAAEAGSEHPLARPILEEAQSMGMTAHAETFETFTGKGVLAYANGSQIAVGTLAWMEASGVDVPPDARTELTRMKTAGMTAVVVALDGEALGLLGIADPVRENARLAVERMRAAGVKKVVMLTGDDALTAQSIADQTGIDEVHAGLLPEDKLNHIRALQRQGYVVAMTGDGINDAPALAAADAGIAMGTAGTGIAIETADIALMADDLLKLPEAVHLSRRVLGNIRQNVVIALTTVALLLVGVLAGEVHMAGGMLIHEASVMIVILNGMRLLWFD
jgi:Cd2+/Zn2+-exporting ATPase